MTKAVSSQDYAHCLQRDNVYDGEQPSLMGEQITVHYKDLSKSVLLPTSSRKTRHFSVGVYAYPVTLQPCYV
eukprot:4090391-Amphidinium_carterae.1